MGSSVGYKKSFVFLRAEMLNEEAMSYLLKFIAVKEPNIRYLGLEGIIFICQYLAYLSNDATCKDPRYPKEYSRKP